MIEPRVLVPGARATCASCGAPLDVPVDLDRPLRVRCGCGAAYDASPERGPDAGPLRTAATTALARRDGVGRLVLDLSGGDMLRHARVAKPLPPPRGMFDWILWAVVFALVLGEAPLSIVLSAGIGTVMREIQHLVRRSFAVDVRVDSREVTWAWRFFPRSRVEVARVHHFESNEMGELLLVEKRGRRRSIIALGPDERDTADWLAGHLNGGLVLARTRR